MEQFAATASTTWEDFTDQHRRVRERALDVAIGKDSAQTAAVVGVYGSGKSTLLFHLLREVPNHSVLAIWEEAGAFADSILQDGERVPAHEFAKRVQEWVGRMRTSEGRSALADSLGQRGRQDVADAVRAQGECTGTRVVLLLDEMEQAYRVFRERVRTDDANPLRALLDTCGPDLGMVVAYAPESFQAVGDADKGRHRVLHVPPIRASAVASVFGLPRGHSNFAWWASRGRARGVIQAVDTIVRPFLQNEFEGDLQGLADAFDALPPIFGVPAIVRDNVPLVDLPKLLGLEPVEGNNREQGVVFDLSNEPQLIGKLEAALMASLPSDARTTVQGLLREMIAIVDAAADSEHRAFVPFAQLESIFKLAAARAQETSGSEEIPEDWRHLVVSALMALGATALPKGLPISLSHLVDELFPSPFTDPLLPIERRHPTRTEVDREYLRLQQGNERGVVVQWRSRGAVLAHDEAAVEKWLAAHPTLTNGTTVLLIGGQQARLGSLSALMRAAGRIEISRLPPFSSQFVKSMLVSSSVGTSAVEAGFDEMAGAVATSKDLQRKVDWHLARLDLIVNEARPQPSATFEDAVEETRSRLLPFLRRSKIRESTGLFALVPVVQDIAGYTKSTLRSLSGLLRRASQLRKVAEGQRVLRGAGVVVDELLPGAGGRWVYDEPHPALRSLLAEHAGAEARRALASLIDTDSAAPLSAVFVADPEELEDPDIDAGLESLKQLGRLVQRTSAIHEGLAQMLGDSKTRVATEVDLGSNIGTVAAARKDIDKLQELLAKKNEIPEPWARVLLQWVAGRFAAAIQANVGNEHAGLREWEACATEGKALGTRAEGLVATMKARGLDGLADTIARGRSQLRHSIDSPTDLRVAQADFDSRLTELDDLAKSLVQLSEVAEGRGVSCKEMLRRYEPEEVEIGDDRALTRRVLDLLDQVGDKPPAPTEGGLHVWMERLADVLSRTRSERLRARLDEILGDCLDTKHLEPVYEDDVAQAEEVWGALIDPFREGVRGEIPVKQPTSSADVAKRLDKALELQRLVEGIAPLDWAGTLDASLLRAAASARHTVEWVTAELEARDGVNEQVINHAGSTAPAGVITDVLSACDSFQQAKAKTGEFLKKADEAWDRLRELEVEQGLDDLDSSDPDAFLADLAFAVSAADDELAGLADEMEIIGRVLRDLGRPPLQRVSSNSVRAIKARVEDARTRVEAAIGERTEEECRRAQELYVAARDVPAEGFAQRVAALLAWSTDLDTVETATRALEALGVTPSAGPPAPADVVQQRIGQETLAAEKRISDLRIQLDRLQVKGRLLGVELEGEVGARRVDVLEEAVHAAMTALQEETTTRVARLSEEARGAWESIQKREGLPDGFVELLDAGLLTELSRVES